MDSYPIWEIRTASVLLSILGVAHIVERIKALRPYLQLAEAKSRLGLREEYETLKRFMVLRFIEAWIAAIGLWLIVIAVYVIDTPWTRLGFGTAFAAGLIVHIRLHHFTEKLLLQVTETPSYVNPQAR